MRTAACMILAAALAGCAGRERPSPEVSIDPYLNDPAFDEARREIVGRQLARLRIPACPAEGTRFRRTEVREISPATRGALAAAGPRYYWTERIEPACPAPPINLLVGIWPDGRPQVESLFPGETQADPLLQRDASISALEMVREARPDLACPQAPEVLNTQVAQPSRPTELGMAWSEQWTGRVCGERIDIGLEFVERPSEGTVISVSVPAG
jgi:hypothetical protein